MTKTSVLLLVYNRPLFVEQQLRLLSQEPQVGTIYIAGDGPKETAADKAQIAAVQKVVQKFVTKSPKRYQLHFSVSHLGCQRGVEQGIDWFFQHVDQGIILEDDCRPDRSFFRYCEELLTKYQADQRVGMISGTKPVLNLSVDESYFFTHHSIIWGWATWKRAWVEYSFTKQQGQKLLQQPLIKQALLEIITPRQLRVIEKVLAGKIDTWDYIWYLTNLLHSRYCILPSQNLVSNVGFIANATHTKLKTTQSELAIQPLHFPLKHPSVMVSNREFGRQYLEQQLKWRVLLSVFLAYGQQGWKKLSA
jgi:hypothetical protein